MEKIEDVKPGMKLPGIVTNITAFGAFIDIGVHQDGLAHISQLSDKYIKDPNEAVKVHQKVMATVLEVDAQRKRIALSLKKNPEQRSGEKAKRRETGKAGSGPFDPAEGFQQEQDLEGGGLKN